MKLKKKTHRSVRAGETRAAYLLLSPYLLIFFAFIILPIIIAVLLSFTNFNSFTFPQFNGVANYTFLFAEDSIFMQYVLPNTIAFSLIVGPVGYILAFLMAWGLAQLPKLPRTVLALLIYSPSMTSGIAMQVVWKTLFSGDQTGYINSVLLNLGIIDAPIQWLQSSEYLMPVMIGVSIWSSMGIGFLSMLAGLINTDHEIYEAAYMDGIKNRFQEIIYVTIPMIKPQMLFGAVMAIVNTFSVGAIGVELSGSNPTPQYSGQLIVTHIDDYGFTRYEMGYAAAISVVLLLIIYLFSIVVRKLFMEKE